MIFYILPFAAILFFVVIYFLTHLIDEAKKGLVKNVPGILLGGFLTGCVGAAVLIGVFSRYPEFFLGGSRGGVGAGDEPGLISLGIYLTKGGLGIIGFLLGFLLGTECLKRKFISIYRKFISIPWKKILIIAVLIAVGAIGYLGYHWYKTSQRPAPPAAPIAPAADETANWNVYQNEEYGFEVKYPPVWELSEKTEILPSIRLEPAEKHFKVEISFLVISPELEFAGIPRTEREGAPETFRQEKTRIENCGNKKVIGNTEFCIEDFACFEGAKLTEYSTINQNKNLIVKSYFTHSSGSFLKCLSDNEVKIELSDFNQILSTFKFIEN